MKQSDHDMDVDVSEVSKLNDEETEEGAKKLDQPRENDDLKRRRKRCLPGVLLGRGSTHVLTTGIGKAGREFESKRGWVQEG